MSCVVVIGMGRSGTSLLSQILQKKGVWFGNDVDLIGQTPINVSGQMENIPIQQVHKNLLKNVFGITTWLFQSELESGWHKSEQVKYYKKQLKSFILLLRDSGYAYNGSRGSIQDFNFAFKDARTTMLLPMWIDIFEELEIEAKYVLCVRKPQDVYYSLVRARDILSNYTKELGYFDSTYLDLYKIWKQYYNNALLVEAFMVEYETWFREEQIVKQEDSYLCKYLNLPEDIGLELINNEERHF